MKRIICLLLLCVLSAVLSPARPTLAQTDQVQAATAEFERGLQLFEAGNQQRALATLRTFVQRYPDHHQSSQAYTLIGRIFTEQKRFSDALLYLERIPDLLRSPEAELLRGYCLVETGDHAAGKQQLLPLLDLPFRSSDARLMLLALVDASVELQQPLEALVYLQRALPLADNQAALLERAHLLLQSRLSNAELEEAAFMWQGSAIGQDARLQLARRALGQQQPQQARQLLQQLLAVGVSFPYWQEAELLLQRTSVDSWFNRDSIGVLLPLSGRYASYGELVKKGLELAVQEHNRTRLPIRLIFQDTAAEGVSIPALVDELSDRDKVMAIIGPLLGASAEQAVARAQLKMVPLLTLSQREGLPQQGDYIFRDSLTAEQQVQSLVRYAIDTQHISFSVMHPQNLLGEKMTRLFVDEVQRLGGEIVDIVSYPEDSTDFQRQIQMLLWEDHVIEPPPQLVEPTLDEQGQEIPTEETEEELPELDYPLAPFHALFIPDYAERVGLLAPQLVFYGIKDVTLLGINGWNSPELAERAGRFLGDAVFVDGFFAGSGRPEVQRFVELYRQNYQEDPTILSAQAFDAANMLLRVMDDAKVENRDDVRRKLSGFGGFRGVAGAVGFDALGEAIRQPYLLEVRGRRIVEID